jgi:hypothetical protein
MPSSVHTLVDAADGASLLAFFSSLLFLTLYTVWYKWWQVSASRFIAILDCGIALALLPSMLHLVFGLEIAENVWFGWLVVIALLIVPYATLSRCWLLIKDQRTYKSLMPEGTRRKDTPV